MDFGVSKNFHRSHQSGRGDTPLLSVVLVACNMPDQAAWTLHSLTPGYQSGVTEQEYEVIVVENKSANNLSAETLRSLPGNFSYHLRPETEPTPVHAVNFGASLARGSNICIMVDGARMLTPGVIWGILRGHSLERDTVVSVPGYHLGQQLQQDAVETGYGVERERVLLQRVNWPEEGYRLFEIACFSGSCLAGIFRPNSESNCISVSKNLWQQLDGFDSRFTLPGGGLVNLDFYRRACEAAGVQHVVLMGEGAFHQFHGGVTTGGIGRAKRELLLEQFNVQYESLRGEPFQPPQTKPVYIGELSPYVERFIRLSVEMQEGQAESKPLRPVSTLRSLSGID